MRYDQMTEVTDERNQTLETCRRCGEQIQPSDGLQIVISWTDWDDPDPDAQGQRKYDYEWVCAVLNGCVKRILDSGSNIEALRWIATDLREFTGEGWSRRAQVILNEIAGVKTEIDYQADLDARERGWGAIGGNQ
jgi:hypothetical protein